MIFLLLCQLHPYHLEWLGRRKLQAYNYESLISHGEEFCQDFLRDLGVEVKFTSLALTAWERGSQENSPLCKKNAGKNPLVDLSRETRDWVVRIGRKVFGVEIEGEGFRVTNVPDSWNGGS